MSNHVFTEPLPGYVAHTAFSRMLATDSDAFDALGLVLEELIPASNHVISAIKKFHNSGTPNETGFCVQNNTSLPLFQFLAQHPERARRFGAGMRFFTRNEGFDLRYLIAGYDWSAFDQPDVSVVDIGGGQGAVSRALASATHHMKFVVQDLASPVEQGTLLLPTELKGRVSFMEHDFFTEQVVKGADIYLFRWILHNWSDEYCSSILRCLVPAMKDEARIVVYEYVLSEGSETRQSEKLGR